MEMIKEATYQAALKVAGTIATHLQQHHDTVTEEGEGDLAVMPTAWQIEKIIDVAFWASLQKEEGYTTRISLAFLSPSQAGKPLLFEHRLPLTPQLLTKLAPGVERRGVHIGVWPDETELRVWGTTTTLPNLCFVLDVSEPGLLVVKHRRAGGLGKFTNVAVLRGDQVKVINENSGLLPDSPLILKYLLGLTTSCLWNHAINVLIQVAVSMREHKRGGTLLITPSNSDAWKGSILHPMQYPVTPPFTGVADLLKHEIKNFTEIFWQNAMKREVENMAGFTAVDGATVINDQLELLAFGAKILRAKDAQPVDKVLFIEPVAGSAPVQVHPSLIGGTRHLSAAQFVHDQQNASVLVASQDGYFTVFSWSAQAQIVQAHRIDILLI